MQTTGLYFIDFDGVICDSVIECYVSSWIAFHSLHSCGLPDHVKIDELRRFRTLRPFIRRGGDYVFLQDLVSQGVPITTQAEFDRRLEELGVESAERNHSAFYKAREQLLGEDKEYWLRLNSLYPGVEKGLRRIANLDEYYILSTKQAPFIAEILLAHNIPWPLDRIIDSGKRVKGTVIQEIMNRVGSRSAIFIDDQIDHLALIDTCEDVGDEKGAENCEIRTFLATWGYVLPSGATEKVDTLSLEEFHTWLIEAAAGKP